MVRLCWKDYIYELNEHERHQKVRNMCGKLSKFPRQYGGMKFMQWKFVEMNEIAISLI